MRKYNFSYTHVIQCLLIYMYANNSERDETFSGGNTVIFSSTARYITLTCSRTFARELSINCVSRLKATKTIIHTANCSVLTTKRNCSTKIYILHHLKR